MKNCGEKSIRAQFMIPKYINNKLMIETRIIDFFGFIVYNSVVLSICFDLA